jgi:NAD-dependent SIR2 family protein deacetylase
MAEEDGIARAAEALSQATALLVTAGAGMGVDSGLPDFRGDHGFWRAYPAYAKLGLSFVELANPRWFREDPELAWGFYGHRQMLYRATKPHTGFEVLLRWARRMKDGAFVFTSNVDAQFQRAGFGEEEIVECHGALEHRQCTRGCGVGIHAASDARIDVDEGTFRARRPLPACASCGALARPNVLMFGDFEWDAARTDAQEERLHAWLSRLGAGARLVVVECGAGTAVPTVRAFSERAARALGGTLVRVNLREAEGPPGTISVAMGAREALAAIDARADTGS